jgi:hypothetical protein
MDDPEHFTSPCPRRPDADDRLVGQGPAVERQPPATGLTQRPASRRFQLRDVGRLGAVRPAAVPTVAVSPTPRRPASGGPPPCSRCCLAKSTAGAVTLPFVTITATSAPCTGLAVPLSTCKSGVPTAEPRTPWRRCLHWITQRRPSGSVAVTSAPRSPPRRWTACCAPGRTFRWGGSVTTTCSLV